jgi:hypothetical protein
VIDDPAVEKRTDQHTWFIYENDGGEAVFNSLDGMPPHLLAPPSFSSPKGGYAEMCEVISTTRVLRTQDRDLSDLSAERDRMID